MLLGRAAALPALLAGAAASVIYFLLMCFRIRRAAEMPPEKAVPYMRAGWILRLMFVVMVAILALKLDFANALAAILGLFLVHIVIIINAMATVAAAYLRKLQQY